ncbi:MAG: hypothetical protein WBQ51_13615, partial [Candidatus Sulfotelmatobacter sp.]
AKEVDAAIGMDASGQKPARKSNALKILTGKIFVMKILERTLQTSAPKSLIPDILINRGGEGGRVTKG